MANTKKKRAIPDHAVLRSEQQIDVQINRRVDLELLMTQMDFTSETIMEAATNQTKLYLQASSLYARAVRELIASESALVVKKAEIGENIRAYAKARAEKVTEASIDQKRRISPEMVNPQTRYEQALTRKDWIWNLLEALRQRRDAIRVISELTRAELASAHNREDA